MANGMPSWEEWSTQLTEEQRRYSLYKVLADLYHREDKRDKSCDERADRCLKLFAKQDETINGLKKRKGFDTTFSGVMGFVGGAVMVIGKKLVGG